MDRLPVEVLAHIFQFLPSLGDRKAACQVCRLWYSALMEPTFREQEAVEVTSEEQLRSLARLHGERRFRHFVLREVDLGPSSRAFWERHGPWARSVTLFNCDVREKAFLELLQKCSRLECLTIQSCRELFMSGRLFDNDREREIASTAFKSLKRLNISYNRYLSDAIFVKFLANCPIVNDLLLSGCQISFHSGLYNKYYPNGHFVPSESVVTFPMVLELVRRRAGILKHLSFSDTFIDSAAVAFLAAVPGLQLDSLRLRACQQLSNDGLVQLSCQQKHLTVLDVGLCPRVTDQALIAISKGLLNLRVLSVQRCRALTDLGIASLSNLTQLRDLNLSECELVTGQGVLTAVGSKRRPGFKQLRLSHLGNLTESDIVDLVRCLPSLTHLDLGFCQNAVSDKAIQAIFANNVSLRSLNLSMCDKVSDSGLTGMGEGYQGKLVESEGLLRFPLGSKAEIEILRDARLKQDVREMCENDFLDAQSSGISLNNLRGLQTLIASGCNRISDVSLKHAFNLNELKVLDLSHCQQVTQDGLFHLSTNNKSLETLNLDQCHNISDEGVSSILKNLKRLKTVIIGSNKVTDKIASIVTRHAKQLTYLDIRHCEQVTATAIYDIKHGLPALHNFHFTTVKSDPDSIPAAPIGLWLKR